MDMERTFDVGKMKELLIDMQDYAWQLLLETDLAEGPPHDIDHARDMFLLKYPGNERIWEEVLEEYEEIGADFFNKNGC